MTSKLREKILNLKKKKLKIGLVHGVFDVLHLGHIIHFEQAKKKVDFLVASVTSDKYVNKSPGKPLFKLNQRMKMLDHIQEIDFVIESNFETAEENIKLIKPDVFFKGTEYKKFDVTGNIDNELKLVKKFGGKTIFTDGDIFSSSKVINNTFDYLSDDVKKFLKKINILKLKNKLSLLQNINKKVLVIGDQIIDTYKMVNLSGKSNKASIVSTQYLSETSYGGGTVLVANILSKFLKNVDFLYPGNSQNNKILNKFLDKKVRKIKYLSKVNFIKKIRYIDSYSGNKLFQNSLNEDDKHSKADSLKFIKVLNKIVKKYDLIYLFDFGYYTFEKDMHKLIKKNKNKFIINCQSNSYNFGFNIATKFNEGGSISMDETEYRLCKQNKNKSLNKLLSDKKNLFRNFKELIVTSGKNGSHILSKNKINFTPAFFQNLIDANGCGDVFLTIYSVARNLCKYSIQEASIISHICAGIHGSYIGNKNYIDYQKLFKVTDNILK